MVLLPSVSLIISSSLFDKFFFFCAEYFAFSRVVRAGAGGLGGQAAGELQCQVEIIIRFSSSSGGFCGGHTTSPVGRGWQHA